jgi:hypothetical protein
MHYTHVRTNHASHKQTCSFTRAEFWAHVEACYKEAYPTTDATGSILSFGLSSFYSSFCEVKPSQAQSVRSDVHFFSRPIRV